ncbi:MAG: hypothetical protein Unbinned202contig1000_41 [Prokaryotic dsDNA virus sp.]|nr:MAG: hypothetical protein Unbinned202contig1000_41 [Prokaryotic dsDNA virus sp.]|tara:strand:- start:15494 stop:15667 length:174 start_codon:yes stop_codon:yes gene_type:complete
MKIDLTLESGLEVEFTPDFKFKNHSEIDEVKWILPESDSTVDKQLLNLKAHIIGKDE